MKLLTTAAEINSELIRLIEKCSNCQLAVAWASVGFPAFDRLCDSASKIERMVVGTHFYQTHPRFIESFLHNRSVRFILRQDGVFHPKAYLFEMPDCSTQCIVGSPNFTHGGMTQNDELAVLVTDQSDAGLKLCEEVKLTIDGYWAKASQITKRQLGAYRAAWMRKRPTLKSLQGRFGDPEEENSDDKGKNSLLVPILTLPWRKYFRSVKSEKQTSYGHCMAGRLEVIKFARRMFSQHEHFRDIERSNRRRIAGLVRPSALDTVDYRWFGSMKGAGKFQHAIKENSEYVSLALDLIPLVGGITRETYLNFVERFKLAFPTWKNGVGTASRLLAMKRPDTFVCFDARNRIGLCQDFGIRRTIGYEEYWDSIIARIMESSWWCSEPPSPGIERSVWEARAAFLDSLYYDGADLPA